MYSVNRLIFRVDKTLQDLTGNLALEAYMSFVDEFTVCGVHYCWDLLLLKARKNWFCYGNKIRDNK